MIYQIAISFSPFFLTLLKNLFIFDFQKVLLELSFPGFVKFGCVAFTEERLLQNSIFSLYWFFKSVVLPSRRVIKKFNSITVESL